MHSHQITNSEIGPYITVNIGKPRSIMFDKRLTLEEANYIIERAHEWRVTDDDDGFIFWSVVTVYGVNFDVMVNRRGIWRITIDQLVD